MLASNLNNGFFVGGRTALRAEMVQNSMFRHDTDCRGGVRRLLVGVDERKKVTPKTVDLNGSYFKFRL